MARKVRAFLDTSVLVAGLWSEKGGARLLLKLGEAETVELVASSQVLAELEEVIRWKVPEQLARLVLILDRSLIQVLPSVSAEQAASAMAYMKTAGDAQVAADAASAGVDFLVTLDRKHFLENHLLIQAVNFNVGTPGDFLTWYRKRYE